MFCELSGVISRKFEDSISVSVGGIGYLVIIAQNLIPNLILRNTIDLLLETKFKVDKIVLFGFLNEFQKFVFNSVSSISGVSDKVALNISGFFLPEELITIIKNPKEKSNFKIIGLGAKTWEKIIFSLQRNENFIRKCESFISDSYDGINKSSTFLGKKISETEAISALINIGINKTTASELVNRAKLKFEDSDVTTEELLKTALSLYSNVN